MGLVRVFTFTGNLKNTLNSRKYINNSNIIFSIQPEIKIFIEDWDKLTTTTQTQIRTDLVGWTEGSE